MRIGALLAAVALAGCATQAGTDATLALPDATLAPTFGSIDLTSGFTPDPFIIEVAAGGAINATSIGSGCKGFISRAPDFRVRYQNSGMPLIFTARSAVDTTLVINTAAAEWRCDDNGAGRHDPRVRIASAPTGVYDVRIGLAARDEDAKPATLSVSEPDR